MEIRIATPDEYAAVGELCVAAYAPFVGDDHEYVAELRDAESRARAAELLVAVDGGQILGTVTYVPHGGPLGEIASPLEAEFRMLAVSGAARGRGVGTALMQRIVDESVARERAGIACSSRPEMRAAHRIYERLGFERARERDWSPLEGVDLMVFVLRL